MNGMHVTCVLIAILDICDPLRENESLLAKVDFAIASPKGKCG